MTALALLLAALAQSGDPPRVARERLVLRTDLGDLTIALYPDVAPRHVAQVLKLARLGVYDSTYFHRIEPGFVAQHLGHMGRERPLTTEQQDALARLPAEFSRIPHDYGIVSMAREDGDENSAVSSWSIVLGRAPHLDGRYTVFGKLEAGQETLRAMLAVPRKGSAPDTRITIRRADVVEREPVYSPAPLGPAPAPAAPLDRPLLIGGAVLTMAGLACSFVARAFMPRWARTICLLVVLVGFFLLYMAGAPSAGGLDSDWLAICLFVAGVGLFRLMATFEAPHPPKMP